MTRQPRPVAPPPKDFTPEQRAAIEEAIAAGKVQRVRPMTVEDDLARVKLKRKWGR